MKTARRKQIAAALRQRAATDSIGFTCHIVARQGLSEVQYSRMFSPSGTDTFILSEDPDFWIEDSVDPRVCIEDRFNWRKTALCFLADMLESPDESMSFEWTNLYA